MNGHKKSGQTKNRINRTIKVAPTTRAIRSALAISATMLALAGSGAAFAGTCSLTGLNEVTCSGVFTDPVEGTVPVINLVPDLTLVLDDTVVVNTDPGETGVSSTWGGDATVISYGEINTVGGDGIYMYSDGTGTVNNYGSIYTYVTADGQQGIDALAYYDVTVVNGGDIAVAAAPLSAYNVQGVIAQSYDGVATVTNQAGGSISASTYSGSAVGVFASGYYGATVDNAGSIAASSFTNTAIGAEAVGKYGDGVVDNSGSIEAYSLTGTSAAAAAVSYFGNAIIDNSGTMDAGGNGNAYGAYAVSVFGTAYVDNSGSIAVTSYQNNATGVFAYGKYADIDNSGDISVLGYSSATGIVAYGVYGANISNTGNITVAAYGAGAEASGIAVSGGGYVNIYNGGTISVTSTGDGSGPATILPYAEGADGVGMSAIATYSETGNVAAFLYGYGPNDVNVVNTGTIYVNVGGNGTGMYGATFGAGDVYLDNQGSVGVYAGGSALGMGAYSDAGAIEVQNSGDVTAGAYFGTAYGIEAETTGAYGSITVNNSGTVDAYTVFDNAYGVSATTSGYDSDISVDNTGSVSAVSYYYSAFGVLAQASGSFSDVSVYSDGGIVASSVYGTAVGIGAVANGYLGDAYVGTGVYSYIDTYSYDSTSLGVLVAATTDGDATLVNAGSITADSVYGTAAGFQIIATGGYGDVYVSNSGDISASSFALAIGGIALTAGYDSDISVYNSGSIYAYGGAQAIGMVASSKYDESQVLVDNSGSIDAYSYGGLAAGLFVVTNGYNSDVAVYNGGDISATAVNSYAIGLLAQSNGAFADVYVGSSGSVSAYSYASDATGIEAIASGYQSDIYVNNSGSVSADSVYGYATGIDATNDTDSGFIYVVNSGDVSANGYYDAIGINAVSIGYYGTTVNNSGSVTVNSVYGDAYGIYTTAEYGDVTVINDGVIDVTANDDAYGIYAESSNGGDLYVGNSGSIDVTSLYGYGYGMYTYADGGGDNTMINSGSITVTAYDGAYGIRGNTSGGNYAQMYVGNSGSIDVTSLYEDAYGIYVDANSYGADITVYNSGSITVSAYDDATGIGTDMDNYAATLIDNSGSIDVSALYGDAYGIYAETDYDSDYSPITISNSGAISATSTYGDAYGIYALASGYGGYGFGSTIDVYNSGSIDATSDYGSATGINADANASATSVYVYNSGTINATGYDYAVGIYAAAGGNYSDATVINVGDVTATAIGAYYTGAAGIAVTSDYSYVYQGGNVSAVAEGIDGAAAFGVAIYGNYFATLVTGAGSSTSASASGYYTAIAEGASLFGDYVAVYGEGAVSASASADAVYSVAYAVGINADGIVASDVFLSGDSDVSADAYSGYIGVAAGVVVDADSVYFYNAGSISAHVEAVYGYAVGVALDGYYGMYAYNYGDISATATGDYVQAVGLYAYSTIGGIGLNNGGDISASADYEAVGVWLNSDSYTFIYNTGTIEASDAAYNVAVYSTGASADVIYNYGTITGALWLGEGDDYLYNDGTWNAGQTPSYFGAGDDGIMNTGTINMDSSIIDLGTFSAYGNFFYNYGTINVNGAFNHIDMGGPMAAIPSLNPLPFYNYGTIDFQDGAANDYLLITGDFAGDGDINVDVSGLNEVSDVLYIDGSVVTGTVNTINVDLLDLPDTIESLIPIVYVTGVSVAGNFVLGDIDWDEDNSFVSLDFGIVADIDATNATPDVFSLGIEVTGLSDPGTIAASIPGSVVSLMNSQVGTWRQRMGVIDSFSKGAIGLWARVFTDKGSFSPEHAADNFGNGGNFDWEQKNSGVEAGIDFSVTDEFSLGLLVAKSEADVHLDNPGVGSSDLDADTWGVYGTWISPNGFYLDASYRWMSFDVDLNSVAGAMQASGDAESFNIEVGYAWTLAGGLKIEPQLQWTKTNVDNLDVLSTTTGMTFTSGGGDSSRGRLGVAIRKSFGDADTGWQWTPYATLSAVREFDGESDYAINNTFFGASTIEGTSTLLELGFTARHQNLSIYGGLNWQDGGAINSFFGGQLGVRYTFGGSAPPPAPVVVAPAKTCADLDDDGDGVNNCDDKCLGSTAGQAVGPDGCPVPAPEPEPVMEPKPFRG